MIGGQTGPHCLVLIVMSLFELRCMQLSSLSGLYYVVGLLVCSRGALRKRGTGQLSERQMFSTGWAHGPRQVLGCFAERGRERELRREGGKSLLAYVKGAGP